MKRKALITFLAMLISLVIVGCGNEPKNTSGETHRTEEHQLNIIKCSIVLSKTSFFKDDSIPVTVKIENVSDRKIDLKIIPSFVLGGLWAPVNIKEGQTLHANTKMTISLEKGDSISSKIDIVKLGWDQVTSSIWPTKNFYSLVSPGKYKLFLDVEIDDKSGNSRIRSNEVEITIEK